MSGDGDSPAATPLVDWLFTFIAVVMAAVVLGLHAGGEKTTDKVSVTAVRELEQGMKLLEAQRSLPDDVRRAIGLGGDGDEGRVEALSAVRDLVDHEKVAPHQLLIACAIAVSHEDDSLALETLDVLAGAPDALSRWSVLVADLQSLARGSPASSAGTLTDQLLSLDASHWLIHRVLYRHYRNAGDAPRAETERKVSQANAVTFVERFTTIVTVAITLGLLGILILVLWPLVRRAVISAGYLGLGSIPSPFDVASTHRVMTLWFLGFMCTGLVLSTLGGGTGMGGGQAIAITMQSLLQGGIAIALIQHFGRRKEDQSPLSVPLRLGLGPQIRGAWGLIMWTVAGLAVGLVVVTVATLITTLAGGASTDPQPALEVFAGLEDVQSRLVIGASVVVFAPLFEEILFRGFLYRNLRDALGPGLAMVTTGLLFGVAHLDPILILPLAGLGTLLAFLFETTGSLLVPIAVHSLWNLCQLLVVFVIAAG